MKQKSFKISAEQKTVSHLCGVFDDRLWYSCQKDVDQSVGIPALGYVVTSFEPGAHAIKSSARYSLSLNSDRF